MRYDWAPEFHTDQVCHRFGGIWKPTTGCPGSLDQRSLGSAGYTPIYTILQIGHNPLLTVYKLPRTSKYPSSPNFKECKGTPAMPIPAIFFEVIFVGGDLWNWQQKLWTSIGRLLAGGSPNPCEKYGPNWITCPNRSENKNIVTPSRWTLSLWDPAYFQNKNR